MSNELSILIPDEKVALRHGINLVMRPCQVKQLKEILGVVSKYIDKIAETEDTIELAKYILEDSGEQGLKDIYLVLRAATNVDAEILEKLDLEFTKKDSLEDKKNKLFDNLLYDELVLLVVRFLEMNKDFFKRIGDKMKPQEEEKSEQKAKTGASK